MPVDYFLNSGVDQHLGTKHAGMVGTVECAAAKSDAVQSALNNRVLLGMNSPAKFMTLARWNMTLFPETPGFGAMLDARRCAIIAGSQDMLVPDDDRPDLATQTGGPLGYHVGKFHKISIPGRTGHRVIT